MQTPQKFCAICHQHISEEFHETAERCVRGKQRVCNVCGFWQLDTGETTRGCDLQRLHRLLMLSPGTSVRALCSLLELEQQQTHDPARKSQNGNRVDPDKHVNQLNHLNQLNQLKQLNHVSR